MIEPNDIPEDRRVVWGESWQDGKFTGLVDGKTVIERRFVANPLPTHLDIDIAPIIRTEDAYHDRLIRITACDQAGNRLPFLMDQIALEIEGDAGPNGPATIPMIGGLASSWVRQRRGGHAKLEVTALSGVLPKATVGLA